MEKTLRHEDYLAMAEENKRLHMENKKLKQGQQPFNIKTLISQLRGFKSWAAAFVLALCIGCGLFRIAKSFVNSNIIPSIDIPNSVEWMAKTPKRNTACYFIQHLMEVRHYEEQIIHDEPWQPYFIYRSPCSNCKNESVELPLGVDKFPTKNEAWAFMMKWNLSACR